jgi:3-hydroxyacyl-CoA dehydrogenase/3a,7a,12a-trihydroxy-5b-cholest-24-enoyl-CoA hydratase
VREIAVTMQFDGKVVVVTGGGGSLGRAYATAFAQRGASVVVNDLGGDTTGHGASQGPADIVADAIRQVGGKAVANYDSVEQGERIVQYALDTYGRIDVVINNAGILRDVSFHKITDEDWDAIYRVHLLGTYKLCRAAWPHLRNQGYGRIVNTSSPAGIYGNFGQANYSAMKLGIHGLSMALAQEGKAKNVLVNTIAPAAMSRLTLTVMSEEQLRNMGPELVAPLVLYLSHDTCREPGGLFEVGGGWIGKLRWQRSHGVHFSPSKPLTPEMLGTDWAAITDFSEGAEYPTTMLEAMGPYEKVMSGKIK